MWTMTPEPCFNIGGSSARSRRTAENKFVLKVCCQSASVRARTPPLGVDEPPTLLTRMSTPPRRSITSLTTFSTPPVVLRSASTNRTAFGKFAVADRAVVITFPPARLRRFTIASPIPLVPPVTRARLPVNSFASNGMSDDVLMLSVVYNNYPTLTLATRSKCQLGPDSKKLNQRVGCFLQTLLEDPMAGVFQHDDRDIIRDQPHLFRELIT